LGLLGEVVSDFVEQYQVKFPRIQSWLRQRFPRVYRLVGHLYSSFLSIDKVRLHRSLKKFVTSERRTSASPLIFVQVGSNDGLTNDPIREFVLSDPTIAVLVEPVPTCFARLKANYEPTAEYKSASFDIRLRQVAIGPVSGPQKFFAVSSRAKSELGEQLPEWWDQIGSFDKSHITRHLDGILAPYIDELLIETLRLEELLNSEDLDHVDVLHIDAEGHDLEVLKSVNLSEAHISCILIEWKHLSTADQIVLVEMLQNHGYEIRKFKSDILATLK
jgi:FkbM family methyltransferase